MARQIILKTALVLILTGLSFETFATKYYISTGGDDLTGDGSAGLPWKSLYKATTMVTTPGDTIFVLAGTYNESSISRLSVGVSLMGEGITSVITSTTLTAEWSPIVDMRSSSFTDGNQSISYLKFDGNNLAAAQAMWIAKRNNVKIHHCTFVNFHYTGIYWYGDGGYVSDDLSVGVPPDNYVTGSEFHDNIMSNCAIFSGGYGRGNLYIGGHEGMLIYNNTITQTERTTGLNGYPIKIWANGGWMKEMKLYNNVLTKLYDGYGSWLFGVESCYLFGCEIYNNVITGALDINFIEKGDYEYGVYIHDNVFGPDADQALYYNGVILEFGVEDIIIERNHFRNCAIGVYHTMRYPKPWVKNVKVRYNKFSNLGAGNNDHYHSAIRFGETEYTFDIEDYEIYNNVFYGDPSQRPYFGIHINGFNTATNITVKNNVFMNMAYTWFTCNRGDYLTNLTIQNNILYNNANSNNTIITGTPTNFVNSGNNTVNPDFFSETNFHPNEGSPLLDAGVLVSSGLYDLDGVAVDDSPNIGCYETVASLAPPVYLSSVVENATPRQIVITYDTPLLSSAPDATAYTVKVNSQSTTVSTVEIAGRLVYLTLTEAVKYGDQVTITYDPPALNPIQTANFVAAAGYTDLIVVNNVKAPTPVPTPVTFLICPNPIVAGEFKVLLGGDIPESPIVLRFYSFSGSLMYEKYLNVDLLGDMIPLTTNLGTGVYLAVLCSSDTILGVCKIIISP